MSLGFDRQLKIVALGDSVKLSVFIRNAKDQLYDPEDISSVIFTVQDPENEKTIVEGSIEGDGSGALVYETDETFIPGHYVGVATFTLTDGSTQSTRSDFELFDPFAVVDTQTRVVADGVWTKLEDCFDSEDEGPWIQDVTMHFFREEKMEKFISEALFDINHQNPPTGLGLDSFVTTAGIPTNDYPLLVQSILVQVIRHLMRSYVEQPAPTGAQIAYQDRRDYLQRWKEVYELEYNTYMRWVSLYKRGFLQLGHSKVLVAAKAGRLIPAPMRARSAGRGYF
jgi:hypothetical protein